MAVVTLAQLLEAGVHFGHQARRWNPKMFPYIYICIHKIVQLKIWPHIYGLKMCHCF